MEFFYWRDIMWFSTILNTFKILESSGSFKLEEVYFSSTR